jgi:glutamate-1-semialdehyde 2,1-aminomutase
MGRKTDELLERARALPELRFGQREIPVVLKAEGARLYDVDNIGYVDYLAGGGAAILGYGNQFVLDAVRKVLASGVPAGAHVVQELDLVEELERFVPWGAAWWFCRNQDEAMSVLMPWLRTTTGKDVILRLDGGGAFHDDGFTPSGQAVRGGATREVPGWDVERIEAALSGGGSKVAAMVVDPLLTGAGVVPPPADAIARIARACEASSILLVMDERVAGFRVHRGGGAGLAGITPDIAVYGGALGGGFPIGGVAFRAGLDAEPTSDLGLQAPHVISIAAAEAVLSVLKNDAIYERLEARTAQLSDGVRALAERFSRPLTVNRVGSVFALYPSQTPVTSAAAAAALDGAWCRRLVGALKGEGVLLPSRPGATAFISNAHGAKDVDETLAAVERVMMRLHQEDLP